MALDAKVMPLHEESREARETLLPSLAVCVTFFFFSKKIGILILFVKNLSGYHK